eukprot:6052669-Pyramimonas_sp.AAC.1
MVPSSSKNIKSNPTDTKIAIQFLIREIFMRLRRSAGGQGDATVGWTRCQGAASKYRAGTM